MTTSIFFGAMLALGTCIAVIADGIRRGREVAVSSKTTELGEPAASCSCSRHLEEALYAVDRRDTGDNEPSDIGSRANEETSASRLIA